MIRLVAILIAAALAIWLLVQIARALSRSEPDWNGIAFAGGFVALAFYLRHTVDLG